MALKICDLIPSDMPLEACIAEEYAKMDSCPETYTRYLNCVMEVILASGYQDGDVFIIDDCEGLDCGYLGCGEEWCPDLASEPGI